MTFRFLSSRRAVEAMLARANQRADLRYAPAMSFAEAPSVQQGTANLPHPGLEAPFDYDAPLNGDPTSIPTSEDARKVRKSIRQRREWRPDFSFPSFVHI
jgi:hypothetical protein